MISVCHNDDTVTELEQKLYEGSLYWRVKLALLEEGYNVFGPQNSVVKYSSFAANNL